MLAVINCGGGGEDSLRTTPLIFFCFCRTNDPALFHAKLPVLGRLTVADVALLLLLMFLLLCLLQFLHDCCYCARNAEECRLTCQCKQKNEKEI